jgi:hypothetical protein
VTGQVLQSGNVTPGHLVSWVTDGVVADSGFTFGNTFGLFVSTRLLVSFGAANIDFQIPINLPVGFTTYRIQDIILNGASAVLSTATIGVFTATGAGGVAVVNGGTAVTVNQTVPDVANSMQRFSINNQNTCAYIDPILYFRVQNPASSICTGNVSVFYQPLP